jgi:hypothetical protein
MGSYLRTLKDFQVKAEITTEDVLGVPLQVYKQRYRSMRDIIAIGDSRADENSVRCHACSRTGSTQQAGWTLRLCGDDELHPFCPDCDRRHVDGRNGTQAKPIPQGMHHRPALGDVA